MTFRSLKMKPILCTFLFMLGLNTPLYSQVGCVPAQTVSGDCVNGYGVVQYADGAKYEGFFKDGMRNGPGRYEKADGSYYIGGWENDKKEYYGYFHWADLDDYFGFFHNDKINGNGVFRECGIDYVGYYCEDGVVKSSSRLDKHERTMGCVAGNCSNGFGKMVYTKDGFGKSCYFVGFFLDGHKQHGMQVEENGETYMGIYDEHLGQWTRSDFGIEKQADGRIHFGYYEEGFAEGLGVSKRGVFGGLNGGLFDGGRLIRDFPADH